MQKFPKLLEKGNFHKGIGDNRNFVTFYLPDKVGLVDEHSVKMEIINHGINLYDFENTAEQILPELFSLRVEVRPITYSDYYFSSIIICISRPHGIKFDITPETQNILTYISKYLQVGDDGFLTFKNYSAIQNCRLKFLPFTISGHHFSYNLYITQTNKEVLSQCMDNFNKILARVKEFDFAKLLKELFVLKMAFKYRDVSTKMKDVIMDTQSIIKGKMLPQREFAFVYKDLNGSQDTVTLSDIK